MKKWVLLLVLISIVQVGYRITSVLAQSHEETAIKEKAAIKEVIENYFRGVANRDINLIMQQISTNYSVLNREGETVDYAGFKSLAEKRIANLVNSSYSDLKISNLNVQDNKATVKMEFNFKGFRLGTSNEIIAKRRALVSLVKEDGSWKIVQLRNMLEEDQKPKPVKSSP